MFQLLAYRSIDMREQWRWQTPPVDSGPSSSSSSSSLTTCRLVGDVTETVYASASASANVT
ncbi:hypothetical protein BLOT_001184 [Blomia tropicalis]|nr:hypothetical protein BLOT_001184 [Blomia tropicalis]